VFNLAGYEPRSLFNVVQFVMSDKENGGVITIEEAMQIMYLRYGRALLDTQLETIFGTSDLNSGKTLTMTSFLKSMHKSQISVLMQK
jgi:calmodulin